MESKLTSSIRKDKTMKVMFMGTPDLARECLRAVYEKDGVEIVAVVTRADKQKGRGMKFVFSPVKEFALEKTCVARRLQSRKFRLCPFF